MEFAIDYAYFLQKRNHLEEALRILMEVMHSVDMDHNPNLQENDLGQNAAIIHSVWGNSFGISRKEFIRLAYGFFKMAEKEDVLLKDLESDIASGKNIVRRTLTIVELQRGDQDRALQLELDYIKVAKFNDLTTAYRRGLVFEAFSKLKEAAEEYEQLLILPPSSINLPDADEEVTANRMMSQTLVISNSQINPEQNKTAFQQDIF